MPIAKIPLPYSCPTRTATPAAFEADEAPAAPADEAVADEPAAPEEAV